MVAQVFKMKTKEAGEDSMEVISINKIPSGLE